MNTWKKFVLWHSLSPVKFGKVTSANSDIQSILGSVFYWAQEKLTKHCWQLPYLFSQNREYGQFETWSSFYSFKLEQSDFICTLIKLANIPGSLKGKIMMKHVYNIIEFLMPKQVGLS
jgi:hypothetical protein